MPTPLDSHLQDYFNSAQLEDPEQAESILSAALSNAAELTKTRTRASESGQQLLRWRLPHRHPSLYS